MEAVLQELQTGRSEGTHGWEADCGGEDVRLAREGESGEEGEVESSPDRPGCERFSLQFIFRILSCQYCMLYVQEGYS